MNSFRIIKKEDTSRFRGKIITANRITISNKKIFTNKTVKNFTSNFTLPQLRSIFNRFWPVYWRPFSPIRKRHEIISHRGSKMETFSKRIANLIRISKHPTDKIRRKHQLMNVSDGSGRFKSYLIQHSLIFLAENRIKILF